MFKTAKKLTVIMLSACMIFSYSGIITHAEGVKVFVISQNVHDMILLASKD